MMPTAKSNAIALLAAAIIASAASAKPVKRKSAVSDEGLLKQAFMLYRSNKFAEAESAFKQCFNKNPLDASVNYYLGMAALYAKDYSTAERALCRVIVMSQPHSTFANSAQQALTGWRAQFHATNQPFSQAPDGLQRWARDKGAIKVCVTDGLQFPKGFYGGDMSPDKCRVIYGPMMQKAFYAKLSRAPGYTPAYRDAVLSGVKDWTFLQKEGIISIEVVDDPTKADVVYVWCKQHGGGHVGMAYYPWSGISNARCICEVETDSPNSWGASAPIRLRETSAHEFGHILGLATHSENPNDVMCGTGKIISYFQSRQYSNTSPVTRNDFITLRALYELPCEAYEPKKW